MTLQPFMRVAATLTLLYAGVFFHSENAGAQVFDFGQIDAFKSMGTGTQRGGSPPKTIVDDGERHTVFLTILKSNTEAKIYWKSMSGEQTTTIIRGPSVKAFQTAGQFKTATKIKVSHMDTCCFVLKIMKAKKSDTA